MVPSNLPFLFWKSTFLSVRETALGLVASSRAERFREVLPLVLNCHCMTSSEGPGAPCLGSGFVGAAHAGLFEGESDDADTERRVRGAGLGDGENCAESRAAAVTASKAKSSFSDHPKAAEFGCWKP